MNATAAPDAISQADLAWIYRSEAFAEDLCDSHPSERQMQAGHSPSPWMRMFQVSAQAGNRMADLGRQFR